MIGHQAFFQVEATQHHPNEFVLLVGDTAKARKGSSFDHVARLLTDAHPSFPSRVTTGLSSGEGLIWAVRDPQDQDPGAHDKRLLVVEPEFASVLKATSREISTLSPTLRSAWDGRPLALLTRTAPATATSAHIAIIGHITQTELARHTTTVELANGFLNRFLICACRRVRLLPEGGDPEPLKGTGLQQYLAAVAAARRHPAPGHARPGRAESCGGTPTRNSPSRSTGSPGTSPPALRRTRSASRCSTRCSTASTQIRSEHLHAALALWDYTSRSARWALGQATGDPLAEQLHAALIRAPDGLTRTQLSHHVHRNLPAEQLDRALQALAAAGRARHTRINTGGRPAERWHASLPA